MKTGSLFACCAMGLLTACATSPTATTDDSPGYAEAAHRCEDASSVPQAVRVVSAGSPVDVQVPGARVMSLYRKCMAEAGFGRGQRPEDGSAK